MLGCARAGVSARSYRFTSGIHFMRADYFRAGTLVVWDVDVLGEPLVRVFRSHDPTIPSIYRSGERAEAEPALPGWSMPVDDLILRD